MKIELLPKNWAKDVMNKIVWGDKEHFYDKPKEVKKEEIK